MTKEKKRGRLTMWFSFSPSPRCFKTIKRTEMFTELNDLLVKQKTRIMSTRAKSENMKPHGHGR